MCTIFFDKILFFGDQKYLLKINSNEKKKILKIIQCASVHIIIKL